jgi:hypothetical protein
MGVAVNTGAAVEMSEAAMLDETGTSVGWERGAVSVSVAVTICVACLLEQALSSVSSKKRK